MSEERNLLRMIAREPDDDAPRLVYADWLEDHGRSDRAEVIRAQIRLAEILRPVAVDVGSAQSGWLHSEPWHCPADSPERRDLAFRCRRLLDAREDEWLAPLGGLLQREWVWSRGFVEVVDANPDSLEVAGEEAFDLHPIRHLIVTGLGGKVDALATIPADNRLIALDLLLGDLDLDSLERLVRFEHLAGLTELSLTFNRLRDTSIPFLCESPFFQHLSLLRLAGNPFSNDGRRRLRDHFGERINFQRERHSGRLFGFRGGDGPGVNGSIEGVKIELWAGWGRDSVQLFFEQNQTGITLRVFDHAGEPIHVETRSGWDGQERRSEEVRSAWMQELGHEPALIRVKRFPGLYDYPKGWSDVFDDPDGEPGDYQGGHCVLRRWMAEAGFRYGSYCGGLWFDRRTGEPHALADVGLLPAEE